jgi:hypothetical protein
MMSVRRYSNRGGCCAMHPSRVRSTDRSIAIPYLYQAALDRPANQHERITARSNRARVRCPRSRRRATLDQPQGEGNRLVGEMPLLHRASPPGRRTGEVGPSSVSDCPTELGRGHDLHAPCGNNA